MSCFCIKCLAANYRVCAPAFTKVSTGSRRLLGQPPVRAEFVPLLETLALPAKTAATGAAPSTLARPVMIGNYVASMVFLSIPQETTRRILPRRLGPAPQDITAPGQHPLLLMYGYQWDVRPPWQTAPGMDYLEIIAAVPYVRWVNADPADPRRFVHMPRLYLDQLLPTALGWICGYAKRLGRFRVQEDDYEVRRRYGNALLGRGKWTPKGMPGSPDDFKHFALVRDVFLQTIIGKTATGLYPCTQINFDLAGARMQAIEAHGEITAGFLSGLTGSSFTVPGIDSAPLGAFRLHTRWELIPPFDCSPRRSTCPEGMP